MQRAGQIALHRDLPVLRVADAKIRIDGERVGSSRGRRIEPVGQRQRIGGAVLHAQALRQRRLLRHLRGDGLIHRSVVVNAIAGANHQRRRRKRTPGDPDARLECRAYRDGPANRDSAGRSACPIGSLATTGASAEKPGAMSRFTRRPYSSVMGEPYSQRTPAFRVNAGADSPIVGEVGVVQRIRENICRRCRTRRSCVGNAQQKIREIGAGGRAGEGKGAAPFCCDSTLNCCFRKSPPNWKLWRARFQKKEAETPLVSLWLLALQRIREPLPAGEGEGRRSPLQGTLIVSGNAGRAGDVLAIFEVRSEVRRKPAELNRRSQTIPA